MSQTKRILVLGADGFIGQRVIAQIAESGWAQPVRGGRRAVAGDGNRIQVDATRADSLRAALDGVDGVVNCIAGSNQTFTANASALAEALAGRELPLVHLSTMSVYGSLAGRVGEAAALPEDGGPYAIAKRTAEKTLAAVPGAVSLRPGIVYGPGSGQWSLRVGDWLRHRQVGDLGTEGDGLCNLVHVDDVARAVLAALLTPAARGQAFNLSLPSPPTWNEYFTRYGIAIGATPIKRLSSRRLKIEAKLFSPPLKIAEIIAAKARLKRSPLPPPVPPSILGLFKQQIALDVSRAESVLGMRWLPLEQGLAETARWYQSLRQ